MPARQLTEDRGRCGARIGQHRGAAPADDQAIIISHSAQGPASRRHGGPGGRIRAAAASLSMATRLDIAIMVQARMGQLAGWTERG